jgi:photosystem II stability/assembly factor-like uncharacterized protein
MNRACFRFLATVASLAFAAACAAANAPAVTVLAQRVAVKDVCAWPKLTLLPDGTVAAAIYNRPHHGRLPGDVAIWVSADAGATWMQRADATRHEPHTAWFNHALGTARNRDLLVVTSGRELSAADDGKPAQHVRFFSPVTARSADGGRTWSVLANVPDAPDGLKLIPFGNIEPGADGALRLAAYTFTGKDQQRAGPRVDTCYVLRSADDGATWAIQSAFGTPAANETDIMHVDGGRWLAAARNLGQTEGRRAHSVDLYVSDDDAATWSLLHGALTQPDQHPADLLLLKDGRIVLTYGNRNAPDFGVEAILSADAGRTWSAPVRLTQGVATRDSGYPSSVQLADGSILTAYYAAKSADYAGYQMAVVHWRLE